MVYEQQKWQRTQARAPDSEGTRWPAVAGGERDTLPRAGTSLARSRRANNCVPARNRRERGARGPGASQDRGSPRGGERLPHKSNKLTGFSLCATRFSREKRGTDNVGDGNGKSLDGHLRSARSGLDLHQAAGLRWPGGGVGRKARPPAGPPQPRAVCPRRPLPQKLPSARVPQQDRAIYSQG